LDEALLCRVEDAGINASAPPQQRWLDGWLVRYNPGKAKRARCINAVAPGRLPLADKLHSPRRSLKRRACPWWCASHPFRNPPGWTPTWQRRLWPDRRHARDGLQHAADVLDKCSLPNDTEWVVAARCRVCPSGWVRSADHHRISALRMPNASWLAGALPGLCHPAPC
jgi:hypothetical protein